MKRIRIVGICLVAVFGLTALAASSASAFPTPEYGKCIKKAVATGSGYSDAGCTKAVGTLAKYEWQGGANTGVTFTAKIKELTKATLETKKKEKVVCNGQTATGKYLNAKEVETTPTFTECSTLSKACSTPGQPEGTIAVAALQGTLGVEKVFINKETLKEESNKNKLASSLSRQSNPGGEIVEFECSGFVIKVKGTVLFPVTSNKMLAVTTLKFVGTGGKQKPEKFWEQPKEVLESKFGGGIFEQSGQTITTIQTSVGGVKVEANSVI